MELENKDKYGSTEVRYPDQIRKYSDEELEQFLTYIKNIDLQCYHDLLDTILTPRVYESKGVNMFNYPGGYAQYTLRSPFVRKTDHTDWFNLQGDLATKVQSEKDRFLRELTTIRKALARVTCRLEIASDR